MKRNAACQSRISVAKSQINTDRVTLTNGYSGEEPGHWPKLTFQLRCVLMPEAKVALVTGAGRGIGRDIAQRLGREGYACGLIARTKSQLDETAELIKQKGGKALVTPTDVSKREQVLASVEAVERELGPISVLINNAGAYLRKPFIETAEEDFDFQLKVNCYGPFFCTQAVVARMAQRGGGTIVFVLGSESRSG